MASVIRKLAWILVLLVASACSGSGPLFAPRQAPLSHEMLNAALWQQNSAEYAAVVEQIYRLARNQLDKALLQPSWTAALEQTNKYGHLPPAIMLDLDETVLDNSRYEARIIKRYGHYSVGTFNQWCEEGGATAVPGAESFLSYAAEMGVAIFYYSSRKEILRACTLANLRNLGLPVMESRSSLFLDDGNKKVAHRELVARDYRILLLIGDNLEDFLGASKSSPGERKALVRQYASYWGSKWIVLPNPMYGHWEAALYGFNYKLPRRTQLEQKRQWLQE